MGSWDSFFGLLKPSAILKKASPQLKKYIFFFLEI